MSFRAIAALAACVLVAAGSATGDPGADKARVDGRLADLRATVARGAEREDVLTSELSAVGARVRDLETGIAAQEARLGVLERRLAGARARVGRLDGTIRLQTHRLERLRREHRIAVARLEQRVRQIYLADDPDVFSFLVETASFSDLLDNLELLSRIGRQDERVARDVEATRDALAAARARTRAARVEAAAAERVVATSTSEQRGLVSRLTASRDSLAAAESAKRATLASIHADRTSALEEIDALEQQSAALAARIQAAQAAAAQAAAAQPAAPDAASVSGSGVLSWPVSGPVTSTFGSRWGRMHEGIDIGVGTGTPVHAAASGTVIYAGWMSGYGNLVVIDHGNGLSTAYAHNSQLVVTVGQGVAGGEIVSYSGSTGNSTGPHVHFEVRVGGAAVDPLGYL